MLPLLLLLLLL